MQVVQHRRDSIFLSCNLWDIALCPMVHDGLLPTPAKPLGWRTEVESVLLVSYCDFHLHPGGQNLITWPHLTVRKVGNVAFILGGHVPH